MSSLQCRMARAALQWSPRRLGAETGIGVAELHRFEGGTSLLPVARLMLLRAVFEEAGVEFQFEGGSGVGVKLRVGPANPLAT